MTKFSKQVEEERKRMDKITKRYCSIRWKKIPEEMLKDDSLMTTWEITDATPGNGGMVLKLADDLKTLRLVPYENTYYIDVWFRVEEVVV